MHSTLAQRTALLAASALGLMLAASSVSAQDEYSTDSTETVTVTAPRLPTPDNSAMAPTSYTNLSVQVRYDDLDLRSRDGARELKERVRDAAHNVCEELRYRYPIALVNQPPCYQKAIEGGMARADNAIADARRYSY